MNYQHKDMVGIGIGPANLALAAAIQERSLLQIHTPSCIFLDKQPKFTWHSGMMLPGANLQVPFLRDLVTLRNPQSPFTFLNYLKENNRLDLFINLRTFYPAREEFHHYLSWVCEKMPHLLQFSSDVRKVIPFKQQHTNTIKQLIVSIFDEGNQHYNELSTSNLVIGAGKQPFLPSVAQINDKRVIHTADLLHQLSQQFSAQDKSYHFTVVGFGQSAGEVVQYLLKQYPNAIIDWCFRSYALHGIDNSPYINQEYHHDAVDRFFNLSLSAKQQALNDLKSSNYAVVDLDILNNLIEHQYNDTLHGKQHLLLNTGVELKAVTTNTAHLNITLENLYDQSTHEINTDALILATGYKDTPLNSLLENVDHYLLKNSDGSYQIDRNYRVLTKPQLQANIYLQGYCEHSHGPSDPTLAILAMKAEKMLSAMLDNSLYIPPLKKVSGF